MSSKASGSAPRFDRRFETRYGACLGPGTSGGGSMAGKNAGKDFDAFKLTIEREVMQHPIVTRNAYTGWFAKGEMSLEHLRHFTVQFSVFSNQFLLAALNRVINADTLDAAHASKEILMNELGVVYHDGRTSMRNAGRLDVTRTPRPGQEDREGDPALVST